MKKHTILVVEDDKTIRELMVQALEFLPDCKGIEAEDGKVALDILMAGAKPDLILLDLQLPQMDGPDFISKVRSSPVTRDIPIIILSGSAKLEEKTSTLPIQGFLKKPWDLDDLLDLVTRLIKPKSFVREASL